MPFLTYDQGKDEQLNSSGANPGGSCVGLAIAWLVQICETPEPQLNDYFTGRYFRGDSDFRLDVDICTTKPAHLMINTLMQKQEQKEAMQRADFLKSEVCCQAGLNHQVTQTLFTELVPTSLFPKDAKEGFYLLSLMPTADQSVGHALGAHVSSGVYRLFDPNEGELRTDDPQEFSQQVAEYWKTWNYNGKNMKTCRVDRFVKPKS